LGRGEGAAEEEFEGGFLHAYFAKDHSEVAHGLGTVNRLTRFDSVYK
jgi:hypothetical protein